jgi:DNA-directed RNA polymerase specialized sigma24 family protein
LSVAETAARMSRTERAVHMLCHRGLEQLRDVLGRSSRFFTRK